MRTNPMIWVLLASLLIIVALLFLLSQESSPYGFSGSSRSIRFYCAASLKPVMQNIAADFEKEAGMRVDFEFGDSGQMLGNVTTRMDGDLFLPADASFIRLAQERGLVTEMFPVCRMRAVVITRHGNPHQIARLDDLLKPGLKVSIANPDKSAIGKVVREHLTKIGKWNALATHLEVQHSNVTESANAVQLGSIDAAIVWDAVAINYPELPVVRMGEFFACVGRVELVVLTSGPNQTGAWRLAQYITASDKGLAQFRRFGFTEVETGSPWVPQNGGP